MAYDPLSNIVSIFVCLEVILMLNNSTILSSFEGFMFDYCISNPPFGVDWKKDQKAVKAEHELGELGRFGVGLPRVSDGQLLFNSMVFQS